MLKKMMLLAMAVGALIAFAASAVAQADVELTNNKEETLGVGTTVMATSTDLQTTIGVNTVSCALVQLNFEVTANGLQHVVLTPVGEAVAVGCNLNGVSAMAVTDWTVLEDLTVNTWGTAEVTAKFIFSLQGFGLGCTLEGVLHIEGIGPGTSGIDVGPAWMSNPGGSESGCISGMEMHGSFTLEDDEGEPVTLDYVETG
jgi:hypothetical protein